MNKPSPTHNLWAFAGYIFAAAVASWGVSLQMLQGQFSGVGGVIAIIITLLCGLRFGPIPLLFIATTYLAFFEPPSMLGNTPVSCVCIALGIGFTTVCLARARSIHSLHELSIWQVRAAMAVPEDFRLEPMLRMLVATVVPIGLSCIVGCFLLWFVPLSGNSLGQYGLRPTALRAMQIAFLLTSAYFIPRLFINHFEFRRMRPLQARVYIGSLLSGWLLSDARRMYRIKPPKRAGRRQPAPTTQK